MRESARVMQFSHSRARRSYGFASGEAYLSDLTLAFLEDTNQYAANYTLAGRLLAPSANPDGGALLSFLQTTSAASNDISDDLNLKVRGPGYLRWGREAGCKFLFNKPDPQAAAQALAAAVSAPLADSKAAQP